MKAFISVDLEGLPHIVIPGQLSLKGSLYEEARKIATRLAITTAQTLYKNGFEQVTIADSHGPMINLLIDDLPEFVEIVRGNLRPISMVSGIDGSDVALFLGYHAKHGTSQSTFDHTYSGSTVHEIKVNNIPCSEFLLNAYVAGEMNIPVILVAGEEKLLVDDVAQHNPWIEQVILKKSLSRFSARSPSLFKIEKNLQRKTKQAVDRYKNKEIKALIVEKPVNVELKFKSTHQAYVAELLPNVQRVNGLTVRYKTETMQDAYKLFQLLVIAASGISSSLERLK